MVELRCSFQRGTSVDGTEVIEARKYWTVRGRDRVEGRRGAGWKVEDRGGQGGGEEGGGRREESTHGYLSTEI